MAFADLTNGAFELLGGFSLWQNVRRLRRDKSIKGVDWRVTLFFTSWGLWNLYYYPHLDQWASFLGGLGIVAANAAWLYYVFKYRRN